MAYSQSVIDHYENPRNVGSFDKSDTDIGTGMVGAPACGDVMKLQIKVQDGIITDARFKTYGCGSAIPPVLSLPSGLKAGRLTKRQLLKIQRLLKNSRCHQSKSIVQSLLKTPSKPL